MRGGEIPTPPAGGNGPLRLVPLDGGEAAMAAAARRWLESTASRAPLDARGLEMGGLFPAVALLRLRVLRSGGGRVLCAFRVPRLLTDAEGRWRTGAIVALMDNIGAAAIVSVLGEIKISVDLDISFYSAAMAGEEVEIEGRMLHKDGHLAAVTMEIRKKVDGSPVAVGRQWMTSWKGKSKL